MQLVFYREVGGIVKLEIAAQAFVSPQRVERLVLIGWPRGFVWEVHFARVLPAMYLPIISILSTTVKLSEQSFDSLSSHYQPIDIGLPLDA